MPHDEKVFPFMEMHIDDSVASVGDDQVCMDEMSFNNSNGVVQDYLTKSDLEIELLRAKKTLAMKHLEIAEVELEIKKTILEKEKKALAQMSQR